MILKMLIREVSQADIDTFEYEEIIQEFTYQKTPVEIMFQKIFLLKRILQKLT